MKRNLEYEIMEEMAERYSTMYFSDAPVEEEDLQAMLLLLPRRLRRTMNSPGVFLWRKLLRTRKCSWNI